MRPPDRIPQNYTERLRLILRDSWRLLKSRFLDGRHPVHTEAPFQHYFAQIISSLGGLHCTRRTDSFLVDLETKCVGIRGKRKYIDITCSFPEQKVSCAVELKFKTARQGAQDEGKVEIYRDVEAVELACLQEGFDFGKFYAITDSTAYVKASRKGVGTVFCTHDGAKAASGVTFCCPAVKWLNGAAVTFRNGYTFEWEQVGGWYFLELTVPKPATAAQDLDKATLPG